MATAETARWFCHTCESEITPTLPDFICSVCSGGFIEKLELREDANINSEDIDTQQQAHVEAGPSPRRTRITIHHIQQAPFGVNQFQDFVSQIVGGLMGGAMAQGPVNIQFAPWLNGPNFGDYVTSQGGLDNVITMLLNQLDGGGPPPAPKDQIDALPTVVIVQEQVDESLQCHICMEEFQLDEKVRGLPCKHIYHGDCIIQWLELHGTCPMCRQRVDATDTSSASNHPSHPPPPLNAPYNPPSAASGPHRPSPNTDIPPD